MRESLIYAKGKNSLRKSQRDGEKAIKYTNIDNKVRERKEKAR